MFKPKQFNSHKTEEKKKKTKQIQTLQITVNNWKSVLKLHLIQLRLI